MMKKTFFFFRNVYSSHEPPLCKLLCYVCLGIIATRASDFFHLNTIIHDENAPKLGVENMY